MLNVGEIGVIIKMGSAIGAMLCGLYANLKQANNYIGDQSDT